VVSDPCYNSWVVWDENQDKIEAIAELSDGIGSNWEKNSIFEV